MTRGPGGRADHPGLWGYTSGRWGPCPWLLAHASVRFRPAPSDRAGAYWIDTALRRTRWGFVRVEKPDSRGRCAICGLHQSDLHAVHGYWVDRNGRNYFFYAHCPGPGGRCAPCRFASPGREVSDQPSGRSRPDARPFCRGPHPGSLNQGVMAMEKARELRRVEVKANPLLQDLLERARAAGVVSHRGRSLSPHGLTTPDHHRSEEPKYRVSPHTHRPPASLTMQLLHLSHPQGPHHQPVPIPTTRQSDAPISLRFAQQIPHLVAV